MQSSVTFTLPILCQICLGKVKEPVTCSNQHAFCSSCMNVWLDRNSRCPTCRVEITSQSPVRKILGGALCSDDSAAHHQSTSRELRRARSELVLKEYEDEIFRLESKVERYEEENSALKDRLRKALSKETESSSQPCLENAEAYSGNNVEEGKELSKKLKESTKNYKKAKKEICDLKEVNESLLKRNDDLKLENMKIREEVITRSPTKFGRLTVATLEARLESSEKQVSQLQKALERNDAYTEILEAELKTIKTSYKTADSRVTGNDNYIMQKYSPITVSIGNEPDNDIVAKAMKSSLQTTTPSNKFKELSLSTPAPPESTDVCDGSVVNNVKVSSIADILNFGEELKEIVYPPTSLIIPPILSKSSSSRKLHFDEPSEDTAHSSQSSDHNFLSIQDAIDLGIDMSLEFTDQELSSSSRQSMKSETTLNAVNAPQQNVAAMKTTIDAGGSRITMSQLSAEEHDKFSRPSSAPSRTFLLSGSRFSALRPLDPPHDGAKDNDFQPVKCISPMHMLSKVTTESEEGKRSSSPLLRLVSPGDVLDSKWRPVRNEGIKVEEDSSRNKDILSRVTILKKKMPHAKTPPPPQSSVSSSSEGRRKQKFSQKRTGEMLFQSPLKSPKV